MDPRVVLRNELRAIITASKLFVKHLRARSAVIQAGYFVNVAMKCNKLAERQDLLLPAYRRQVERITQEFNYQVELAYEKYPELRRIPKRSRIGSKMAKEPTKAHKVSITLPALEWDVIDESIRQGNSNSRSEYFRKLHMTKRK